MKLPSSGVETSKPNGDAKSATDRSDSGAAVYNAFLAEGLQQQSARKASFEQRGVAVVTTSGVLVTLLLALSGLSRSNSALVLPHASHGWLIASLASFVVAALLALVTNAPLTYEAVVADQIRDRLRADPPRDAAAAERDVALTRVKALRDAKRKNSWKGRFLFGAIFAEVVAVACLGVAVCFVIAP